MKVPKKLLVQVCYFVLLAHIQAVNGCDPGWTENPATANGCGAGWTKNPTTGSCYKILMDSGTTSWYNAKPQCESENAELASIRTSQEWTFVKDLVSNSGINGVWLGGNDIPLYVKNTGKWLWADGSTVKYEAWRGGLPRPNNNFNCMRVIEQYAWEWTDYYCASTTQYPLCKKPATCYKILMENGTTSWYDAKKNCESQQAELASIRSSQEWTLVKDLVLKSGINGIWLGGSDIADKNTGIWKWTDGSRFTYTAWKNGLPRPNNNFNCLRAIATFAWEWTDYYCDSNTQYAICKIPG